MKRNIFYIAIAITFFLALNFYFKVPEPKARHICPEDFPETDAGFEEKRVALDGWINGFYDKNPNASLSEFSKARFKFYLENKCDRTLQRYYEAKEGKGDTEEMKMIRETINEEMRKQQMENLIEALKKDESKQ